MIGEEKYHEERIKGEGEVIHPTTGNMNEEAVYILTLYVLATITLTHNQK